MTSQPEQLSANEEITEIDSQVSLGATVPVDPDVAEEMGAFDETALDDTEAQLSFLVIDRKTNELLEKGGFV